MLVPANPPVDFAPSKFQSFINQDSTGQVTVELEWQLQREDLRCWNPEVQYTETFSSVWDLAFAPNAAGEQVEPPAVGTCYLTRPLFHTLQ